MTGTVARVLAAASLAAALAAAMVWGLYHPMAEAALEMDRRLPEGTSGFHAPESDGSRTFAWTRRQADLPLHGLDRRSAARCVVRLSGARPAGQPRPDVRVLADSTTYLERTAPADYEDLAFELAPRPGSAGATIRIEVSSVFRPGTADTRALGVAVDRVSCRSSATASSAPPAGAAAGPAAAAAILAVSIGAVGATAAAAWFAAGLGGAVAAWLVSIGHAAYGSYPVSLGLLALGVGLGQAATALIARRASRAPLSPEARFAVVVSAVVLFVKLAALFHPLKASVDVVFQAHRFEWVLDGRFFFTSLTPGLYQFPYGISLYLVAAPFAWMTADYPALLRVVTCASEAAAGLLLYAMVVRTWGDRFVAAAATLCFHLAPIAYGVIGAANLTNAFGEHLALATVAAVVLAPLTTPARWSTLAVGGLAALAFVSHFGTFALLGVTLFAMAAWMAAAGGPAWRDQARTLAATIAIGVVLATAGYYGHFWDVYVSQASRVMAESRRPAAESDRGDDVDQASSSSFGSDLESLDPEALAAARQRASERTKARRARPLMERLGGAMTQAAKPIGLPLLVLSVIGAAWVVAGKRRDAIVWALAGWATMCVVFILVGVFTPVRMRYFFAAVPAVAILAAAGTGWLWRAGLWGRAAAAGVFAWAGVTAAQAWLRWVTLP